MTKFKVGDRVLCKKVEAGSTYLINKPGTVKLIDNMIMVRLDEPWVHPATAKKWCSDDKPNECLAFSPRELELLADVKKPVVTGRKSFYQSDSPLTLLELYELQQRQQQQVQTVPEEDTEQE